MDLSNHSSFEEINQLENQIAQKKTVLDQIARSKASWIDRLQSLLNTQTIVLDRSYRNPEISKEIKEEHLDMDTFKNYESLDVVPVSLCDPTFPSAPVSPVSNVDSLGSDSSLSRLLREPLAVTTNMDVMEEGLDDVIVTGVSAKSSLLSGTVNGLGADLDLF